MIHSMRVHVVRLTTLLLVLIGLIGCQTGGGKGPPVGPTVAHGPRWTPGGPRVRGMDLDTFGRPQVHDQVISISGARNEWTSFILELTDLPRDPKRTYTLRLNPLRLAGGTTTINREHVTAYRLVALPFQINQAQYIRHTGQPAEQRDLPRALLPLDVSDGGRISLAKLDRAQPLHVWVDVHVPSDAEAGRYIAHCDVVDDRSRRAVASVDAELTVHDFAIPDQRNLLMVADLDWQDLRRLYPAAFEAVRPQLIRRDDPEFARTVKVLDDLISLGQQHRAEVVVSRLQPTVKWLWGRPPQIEREALDSVLKPWLDGSAFANGLPLGFWPLPAIDQLPAYDPQSRGEYWQAVAVHFERNDWLARAPVVLGDRETSRPGTIRSIELSTDAAQVLSSHPRVRVLAPLEPDQLQLAADSGGAGIDPADTTRIIAMSPGLVSSAPAQRWPKDVARPDIWLSTDDAAHAPLSAASEADVRLWAWLAFLRSELRAGAASPRPIIVWPSPLPKTSDPGEPGNPDDVAWFYPGEWFGRADPVPSVQLKWLRRAQQDFEYLRLARLRGETINAMLLARLMVKPVDLQPGQILDSSYALLSGTSDPRDWDEASRLLARSILLRHPGELEDPNARNQLNLQLLHWTAPRERPMLMARDAEWLFDTANVDQPGQWAHLMLGVDIYNASDRPPSENLLRWTNVAPPWQVRPYSLEVPTLEEYRVQRHEMEAGVNLEQLRSAATAPLELTFTDGYQGRDWTLPLVLPVAASDRRRPGLVIDGSLDDWTSAEAIQDGPMVRLLDRPALQGQQIERASTPASIYTGWSDDILYVAFRLEGMDATRPTSTWNFVNYQGRRAWGEDLAQILVQPIYEDNTLGPVLHVVCKPTGHWVERRSDGSSDAEPWQAIEGTGLRYFASWPDGVWRGEVAIPWRAILDPDRPRPKLLRFNFTQHKTATAESASWAGPIDFGRDESFMGLLYLRDDGAQ